MERNIKIYLDNGGGLQLETAKFCHSDYAPMQAAHDVREFINTGDTSDWDGNQPEHRVGPNPGSETQTLDRDELQAIIEAGKAITKVGNGATAMSLLYFLLGSEACGLIAEEHDRQMRD